MDKASTRARLCVDLHKLAESNPSLRGKLVFPTLNESALLSLIFLICPNCNGKRGGLKVNFLYIFLSAYIEVPKNYVQIKSAM